MTRPYCHLYFSGWSAPELFRVVFLPEGASTPIVSARGKTARGFRATASFQWTSAVRAFAILLVERGTTGGAQELSSDSDALARSLDYALGRRPAWLSEMFGFTHAGKPLSQRLFERNNPDGRRPGPVSVMLNSSFWNAFDVRILVDGKPVTAPGELCQLARLLRGLPQRGTPKKIIEKNSIEEAKSFHEPATGSSYEVLRGLLREPFDKALLFGLTSVNPLNQLGLKHFLERIAKFPSYQRVAGKRAGELSEISVPANSLSRLALAESAEESINYLRGLDPITLNTPAALVGSAALFHYLRDFCRIPFRIRCDYPHAVFVASSFVKQNFLDEPDLVALGVGPAAHVLGGDRTCSYAPLFPLPCMSAQVFTHGKATDQEEKKPARYVLLSDEPSNPLFLYEDLRAAGLAKGSPIHAETDETYQMLEDDANLRAIIFFPYDVLNIKLNSCREVPIPEGAYKPDLLLFGKQEIAKNQALRHHLGVALRHAWFELLANPALRRGVIDSILADENYLKVIFRTSGLCSKLSAMAARQDSAPI